MSNNKIKISILGSTGSIGTQALEVIEKLRDKFEIIALSGGSNVELLKQQAEKFHPKYICIGNSNEKLTLPNIEIFLCKTVGRVYEIFFLLYTVTG